jgi:hypothetical protein
MSCGVLLLFMWVVGMHSLLGPEVGWWRVGRKEGKGRKDNQAALGRNPSVVIQDGHSLVASFASSSHKTVAR